VLGTGGVSSSRRGIDEQNQFLFDSTSSASPATPNVTMYLRGRENPMTSFSPIFVSHFFKLRKTRCRFKGDLTITAMH
jgi:hypothetical protein